MKNAFKLNILLFVLALLFSAGCKPDDKNKNSSEDILSKPPLTALTDSIKRFPDDPDLYFRRAEILSQHNLHEMASSDYKRSWALKPAEETGLRYASNLSIINKEEDAIRLLQSCIQ